MDSIPLALGRRELDVSADCLTEASISNLFAGALRHITVWIQQVVSTTSLNKELLWILVRYKSSIRDKFS